MRFYEWAGKQGDVTLQLPPGAESARQTDLMEKGDATLPVNDGVVKVPTKAYEIKTVKVQFSGMPQTPANNP